MITVFSKPGCRGCIQTKNALTRKGLEFVARDISEDDEAAQTVDTLLVEHPTIKAFPIVVAGDDVWGGHDPARLESLGE